MDTELSLALIGGGNMASALANGLIGRRYEAASLHVIDPNESVRRRWAEKGASTAAGPDALLEDCPVWIFAVKPQVMADVVRQCKPRLKPGTLAISIAAGIPAEAIARWLGNGDQPYTRVVRCMPNMPALITRGITGMVSLPGVTAEDRVMAEQLLRAVGDTLWVDDEAAIDAVTAVSGSGPAYVFLFLEAMIAAGVAQGLSEKIARKLALTTFNGAAQMATLSGESPATLRERVTSKGGTTEAALAVFRARDLMGTTRDAVAAAARRAQELADQFSR